MRTQVVLRIASAVAVLLSLMLPVSVYSRAMSFPGITSSPRGNAMGGCVTTLADEESPLYNPGSLGALHLKKTVSVIVPLSTRWLPTAGSDPRLNVWGLSVGHVVRETVSKRSGLRQVSIAAGWYRRSLASEDSDGHRYNHQNCFTFAVGWNATAKFGLGISYRPLKYSTPKRKGLGWVDDVESSTSCDAGLYCEVPLDRLLDPNRADDEEWGQGSRTHVTGYAGIVMAGLGTHVKYSPIEDSAGVMRYNRLGLAVQISRTHRAATIAAVRLAMEWELDDETGGLDTSYYSAVQTNNARTEYKYGIEVNALGALFFRAGHMNMVTNTKPNTYGFGFSLSGLVRWLSPSNMQPGAVESRRSLLSRVDLSCDYARYCGPNARLLTNSRFVTLRLSI